MYEIVYQKMRRSVYKTLENAKFLSLQDAILVGSNLQKVVRRVWIVDEHNRTVYDCFTAEYG